MLPFVSIIIPCYNEKKYIAPCLDSIIAGDYPKMLLEVLVVDGMSNDGTRDIIKRYCEDNTFINMIDNHNRYTPFAMNLGIKAAKGSVVMIMGCHADYPSDYISKCSFYLRTLKADNVGGILVTKPFDNSLIAKSIAEVMSSFFGMGNSYFRTGSKEIKEVDTVFGGCYPVRIFKKIGLFNERLKRGQDREFNLRLKKNGGKIILVPDIRCTYYARGNLSSHLKHIFFSSHVLFQVSRIIGEFMLSWRNLVPPAFVLSLIILPLLSLLNPIFLWFFGAEIVIYLSCAIIASTPAVKQEKDYRFFMAMPFVFALTHVVYGSGWLMGLFKSIKEATK